MGSGIYRNGKFYGGTFDYDELKNKPPEVIVTDTGDIYIGSQLVRKVLTQAEYDALSVKDPKVEYLIPEVVEGA